MGEICFAHEGCALFAGEHGDGRPIVLLHGGLANHQAAVRFAAPLADRFRLITPDLRASGRSVFHGELTWDLLADDVAALLRHLGITRAVIGGASFGAGVATRVALRHPELVDALVILMPAFGGADLGLTAAQQAAMRAMDDAGRRAPDEGVAVLFPLVEALPAELRDRARAVFATYDPRSVAASTRFMASGAQPFARGDDLAAIAAPTLVVPGVDPTHPPEVAARFATWIPGAVVREAAPEAYARVIEEFLG